MTHSGMEMKFEPFIVLLLGQLCNITVYGGGGSFAVYFNGFTLLKKTKVIHINDVPY